MFISSLTLTAVILACFCVARVSEASTTTSTPSSGAGTQASSRRGNHHHHHQETEDSGGGFHSGPMKIHNFISTDALYDGEQERRVHYNGVTAKETAVTTLGEGNSTRLVTSFISDRWHCQNFT